MIRLLVLDVDGTMTDGGVYYDATGNELKKFAIKDGAGLVRSIPSSAPPVCPPCLWRPACPRWWARSTTPATSC